ncbi:MAG: hypothetical protein GX221_04005 [Candidatus Riflebacteria bacterium]|nr:hypothetical protein [Candidatus Riflebacteria bacterium]
MSQLEEILKEGFSEAEKNLAAVTEAAKSAAASYRLGDEKSAMSDFLMLLEGLEWLNLMLVKAPGVFAAKLSETSLGTRLYNLMDSLQERTAALEKAQAASDWVNAADILEYEFPEILKEAADFMREVSL